MDAEDFQDLYKLLRGSKSAFAVLDARTQFIEKKMQLALSKLEEAKQSYEQSRSRLMKLPAEKQIDAKAADADRQLRRIERKQEKVREILKKFDEIIPVVAKLATKEKAKLTEIKEDDTSVTDPSLEATVEIDRERPVMPADLSLEFTKRFLETEGDEQLELISRHFGFRPVASQDDIQPNSVYFIKVEDESFLVHTKGQESLTEGVPLVSAVDEIPMKTYSHEAFLRMGERRRMVLLTTDEEMPLE